jgi:hypothetical protein
MTDTVTSENIDLSSWNTIYFGDSFKRRHDFLRTKQTLLIRKKAWRNEKHTLQKKSLQWRFVNSFTHLPLLGTIVMTSSGTGKCCRKALWNEVDGIYPSHLNLTSSPESNSQYIALNVPSRNTLICL